VRLESTPVARIASIVIVLALLGGTAVAFAVTERLKLERSPIAGPEIDKVFSPVCGCDTAEAQIAFRLRERDRISLAIVDAEGRVVRHLVDGEQRAAGRFATAWDGRDDAGALVPEASYRPRLDLRRDRRTIVLPNPIRVDTTRPRVRLVDLRPEGGFSPDGDGRNDRLTVRYAVNERAHGLLFVGGRRLVRTRFKPFEGRMEWFGIVNGRSLPAGVYPIQIGAEDVAGNLARRTAAVAVEIRYISLARGAMSVRARTRFGIRVSSDARSFRWRFAGGTGAARPGLLVLRAPRRPGRYTLFVSANGHGAQARVQVIARASRRTG
jgi:flagellar hook capping protein FlgD